MALPQEWSEPPLQPYPGQSHHGMTLQCCMLPRWNCLLAAWSGETVAWERTASTAAPDLVVQLPAARHEHAPLMSTDSPQSPSKYTPRYMAASTAPVTVGKYAALTADQAPPPSSRRAQAKALRQALSRLDHLLDKPSSHVQTCVDHAERAVHEWLASIRPTFRYIPARPQRPMSSSSGRSRRSRLGSRRSFRSGSPHSQHTQPGPTTSAKLGHTATGGHAHPGVVSRAARDRLAVRTVRPETREPKAPHPADVDLSEVGNTIPSLRAALNGECSRIGHPSTHPLILCVRGRSSVERVSLREKQACDGASDDNQTLQSTLTSVSMSGNRRGIDRHMVCACVCCAHEVVGRRCACSTKLDARQ